MEKVQKVVVEADFADQRLDNYLLRELKGVPRAKIYQIIRSGEVRVNGGRAKPSRRLIAGDLLRIPPIRESSAVQASVKIDKNIIKTIIYEDELKLVINKAPGVAVHGGSGVSFGVIEALRLVKPSDSLELVHRLDRETSGCLLIAKRRSYLKQVHDGFRQSGESTTGHLKQYLAVVEGRWPKRKVIVNSPIRKNQLKSGERFSAVDIEGKASRTLFEVLCQTEGYSLLLVTPETGRTHQIRVHCQYAGHAVAGDDRYGDKVGLQRLKDLGYRRMMLHALALRLEVPESTGKRDFLAPVTGEMERFVGQVMAYDLHKLYKRLNPAWAERTEPPCEIE